MDDPQNQSANPVQQGISPISGTTPPAEYRFKPGQSGNPAGRARNAGSSVREWMNVLADCTEAEIRQVYNDPSNSWAKRTAARDMLEGLENPDIASFAPVINGKMNIEELRESGVNTEVVKKFKQKSRIVPIGDGMTEEIIEREIELRDRGGVTRERVADRTAGKPISHDIEERMGAMERRLVDKQEAAQ